MQLVWWELQHLTSNLKWVNEKKMSIKEQLLTWAFTVQSQNSTNYLRFCSRKFFTLNKSLKPLRLVLEAAFTHYFFPLVSLHFSSSKPLRLSRKEKNYISHASRLKIDKNQRISVIKNKVHFNAIRYERYMKLAICYK